MPRARQLIDNASFASDTLKMLATVFDEVWASVGADFADRPEQVETARIKLATIILDLAKDRQLGPLQIASTAARITRQERAGTKQS